MDEKKNCRNCGRKLSRFGGYQHRDNDKEWGYPEKLYYLCEGCENKFRLQDMKERILSGEENNPYNDILFVDGYYCPYCGEYFEINDEYDLLADGDHRVECPDCGKVFTLNTYVSYSFDTERID